MVSFLSPIYHFFCMSRGVVESCSVTPSAEDGGDERGKGSSTETGSEGEAVVVSKLNLQPHTAAGQYDPNRSAYCPECRR